MPSLRQGLTRHHHARRKPGSRELECREPGACTPGDDFHSHDFFDQRVSLRSIALVEFAIAALLCLIGQFTMAPQAVAQHAPGAVMAAADHATLQSVNEEIDGELERPEAVSFDPGWWRSLVSQPIRSDNASVELSLESTLIRAIDHSKQIKVFSELPLIRETAIIEADAAFDWLSFSGRSKSLANCR